jgi:predicted permease
MNIAGAAVDSIFQDLRYAVRALLREPVFAVVAVVTLALGIGVTTGVFALVNAALLRPLPIENPARVMMVEEVAENGRSRGSFSYREYVEHRERAAAFSSLAAHNLDELSYRGDAGAEVVLVGMVSSNYFTTLGLQPQIGRFLTAEEERGLPVVVLAYDFWRARFDSDHGVLGRTIVLNGQSLTVVGVAPETFRGTFIGISPVAWGPLGLHVRLHPGSVAMDGDKFFWLQLIGRLAPGVSRAQAEGVVSSAARSIPAVDGAAREVRGARVRRLTGLPPGRTGVIAGFLGLLLTTAGLVLVIASVNVAGMLLARATARRREIAMRVAIGASRWRLLRQLFTETMVLFGLGGSLGLLLAAWVAYLLSRFRPPAPVTLAIELSVDGRVFGFALLVATVTGALFGAAPVAHALNPNLMRGIREGGSSGTRHRTRSVLVVAQFALSLVLLVAAGLFARVIRAAASAEPGFDASAVAAAHLDLEPHGYDEVSSRVFMRTLLGRLEATAGVEGAGLAEVVPLGFSRQSAAVEVSGREAIADRNITTVDYNVIDPGYLGTLRIPLIAGRGFTADDREGALPVAIINETFARRFFPNGDALGGRINVDGKQKTVVGITGDSRYRTLLEQPLPHVYAPYDQNHIFDVAVFVRGRTDAAAVLAALQREVRALDPDVPLVDGQPLEDFVALSVFPQRVAATLIGVFGLLGLVLAAVGIYGVMAFSVSRRTREIGVRMALGADGRVLSRAVALHGLRLAGIGVALGGAAAMLVTRVLVGLLPGISPTDPVTFVGVATTLVGIALAASYIPARRAASIDPVSALRAE